MHGIVTNLWLCICTLIQYVSCRLDLASSHSDICGGPAVLNVGNEIGSVCKYANMVGNPLLAEKELALASRCGSLSSSMQKSHTSSCPTITYEEALKRELEYRKRLESTHPHLLIGLNGAPVLPKVSFLSDNFSVSSIHSERQRI